MAFYILGPILILLINWMGVKVCSINQYYNSFDFLAVLRLGRRLSRDGKTVLRYCRSPFSVRDGWSR